MTPPRADVVVVGAGIVGLAAAAALTRRDRSVWILESEGAIAQGATSRNSEVIHAGFYDPPESLKATLCNAGREALYARCREWRIPHRRLGKLVVATRESERSTLEDLLARGTENGVPGLELIGARALRRLEPDLHVIAALCSPESGIVDAHSLALSYLAEAEQGGAVLFLRTCVEEVTIRSQGWRLGVRGATGDREWIDCRAVVNAAGLASDRLASLAGINVESRGYGLHFCKGDYFRLVPGAPLHLSRLIYPLPDAAGLGIHATLDLAGGIRFGPDAEFVSEISYRVDPAKVARFGDCVRRYLPALRDEWLTPDYAGIRARRAGPGDGFRDFVVAEESAAGLPGWVNCIGIESPGLTAAPAIGLRVAALLEGL